NVVTAFPGAYDEPRLEPCGLRLVWRPRERCGRRVALNEWTSMVLERGEWDPPQTIVGDDSQMTDARRQTVDEGLQPESGTQPLHRWGRFARRTTGYEACMPVRHQLA